MNRIFHLADPLLELFKGIMERVMKTNYGLLKQLHRITVS